MRSSFLLLLGAILLTSCGGDDDTFSAQLTLNRFDGWQLESVTSDLAAVSAAASEAVTDSTLAAANITREELVTSVSDYVDRITGLEDCERDDVLFFNDGVVAFGRTGTVCTDPPERHILIPFDAKSYSTDLEVTRITVVDPATGNSSDYRVDALTATSLVISRMRVEQPILLLGPLNYSITYSFRAR